MYKMYHTFGHLVEMTPQQALAPHIITLPETTECLPFKPCYIKHAPECKLKPYTNVFFDAFPGKDMVLCVKPEEDDNYVSTLIRETVSVQLFRQF